MPVDSCPICGISESIPSPDHDHRANFTYETFPGEYAAIERQARPTPVEPEAPEPLVIEPWRELLEAWLHSGGMDRDELGRLITSTERSLAASEVGYHAIDPEPEAHPDEPLRTRLARALWEANDGSRFEDEYTISERMQSVHGGPADMSYIDAADMILGTPSMLDFASRRLAVEPDGLPLDVPFTPWLALAIDGHALAYPANDSLHYDGMCSSDCAGDIAARYRVVAASRGAPSEDEQPR